MEKLHVWICESAPVKEKIYQENVIITVAINRDGNVLKKLYAHAIDIIREIESKICNVFAIVFMCFRQGPKYMPRINANANDVLFFLAYPLPLNSSLFAYFLRKHDNVNSLQFRWRFFFFRPAILLLCYQMELLMVSANGLTHHHCAPSKMRRCVRRILNWCNLWWFVRT